MDERPGAAAFMKTNLSVIIPAFNEAERLGGTLETIRRYAAHTTGRVELIVVDDGSSDQTADLVRELTPGDLQVRLLVNAENSGKGYSVRRGMLEATGDVLLMFDADGSTPIDQVDKLLLSIEDGADVAIGSRAMPDAQLDPPPSLKRRIMQRVFSAIRGALMLPKIRDTQCGFKAFTRPAARHIFSLAVEDGFAFDCEILALAEKLGYRVDEVGVLWRHHEGSSIRPLRDSRRMLLALLRMRRRLKKMSPEAIQSGRST